MKKINKMLFGSMFLLILVGAGSIWYWDSLNYPATEIALESIRSNSEVLVSEEEVWIIFEPVVRPRPSTGFVFYPGAGVDFRAYSPVLRDLAARGFFVIVVRSPLNLAFFDINAAEEVITKHPEVEHWVVAGHSLGGVAASSYASSRTESVEGVVLWASYPADDSLRMSGVKVASIYGTLDGLTVIENIEASKSLLPTDTEYIAIEGGNHSQFGAYGFQNGDNPASITGDEQWRLIVDATVNFLEKMTE